VVVVDGEVVVDLEVVVVAAEVAAVDVEVEISLLQITLGFFYL
jgi:hypothetical protein